MRRITKYISLIVPMFLSACGGISSSSNSTTNRSESIEDAGFSERYNEYYSGYWNANGRFCVDNGFAKLGVIGKIVELQSGTDRVAPLFGEIDSQGNITFPVRQTGGYCDGCEDHKYLHTSGRLDWNSGTATISMQFTCKSISTNEYFYNIANIELLTGLVHPEPYEEMSRLENEIKAAAGSDHPCVAGSECRFLHYSLDEPENCNNMSIVYSTRNADEQKLFELRDLYQKNAVLTGLYNGSNFTLCSTSLLDCVAEQCTPSY